MSLKLQNGELSSFRDMTDYVEFLSCKSPVE